MLEVIDYSRNIPLVEVVFLKISLPGKRDASQLRIPIYHQTSFSLISASGKVASPFLLKSSTSQTLKLWQMLTKRSHIKCLPNVGLQHSPTHVVLNVSRKIKNGKYNHPKLINGTHQSEAMKCYLEGETWFWYHIAFYETSCNLL